MNAVLRSGTNQFHGTVYEFLRNTDLNAIGYVFGARPSTFVQPTFHRNQFGATFGGPIIKDKLFFFVDYEGVRQAQGYLNFYTVPDTNDRAGILPVTVVDPLTGVVYTAGTQIPVAQLNPFAAAALAGLPGAVNATRANNLEDNGSGHRQERQIRREAGLSSPKQNEPVPAVQPAEGHIVLWAGRSGPFGRRRATALSTRFSSRQPSATPGRYRRPRCWKGVLDSITCWAERRRPYLGGANIAAEYGIQGLSSSLAGGFPTQVITGFKHQSDLRQASHQPAVSESDVVQPQAQLLVIKGQHSIKVGYEFIAIRTEVLDINPLYGQDTYNGQYSKPTAAQCGCTPVADATSYDLADFYFGLPSSIAQGSNLTTNLRQHVHSLYVQDDWRVTPKLTVNVGLRWEFATPQWERDNLWSNFDPTTNTLVRATNGSLYDRALVNPNYKDFGPRLGLAYSIDPKTVIRAGYGISYAFFNRPGSAEEGINGPLAVFGSYNNPTTFGPGFLTTQNGFNAGIASNFNPLNSNNDYIPAKSPWPYVQSWVLSIQREIAKDTVVEVAYNGNHSVHLPILGDYNQAAPNPVTPTCNGQVTPAITSGCLGIQARRPDPSFDGITWVDPAGNNEYNGLSARLEHRFAQGLYFLNSFTWGKALGDSEQALEYYSNLTGANPQNIQNLAAERGPSSYDVKLVNVTSVVYQLPFGKGHQFLGSLNPALDAVLGGWELNAINTANTGLPVNVYYAPTTQGSVSDINAEYRGQPFLRPNVSGSAASQSTGTEFAHLFRRLHVYHALGEHPLRQSGTQRVSRAGARAVGPGHQQELPHPGNHAAPVPQRVLQHPEPHELRRHQAISARVRRLARSPQRCRRGRSSSD